MPKIICISGKAQHGKDTVANYIYSMLSSSGKRVLVIHNADLLKYVCQQLFGWNGIKDENGRQLLQYIGTDVVRSKEPSFWVDFVIKMVQLFDANWDYVLVPDCRFQNEISRHIESGFSLLHIRVTRDSCDDGLTHDQRVHSSEIAHEEIDADFTIDNNSTFEYLKTQIVSMFNENRSFFDDVMDLSFDIWRLTEGAN